MKASAFTLKLQDKIHIEGKELFNDRITDAAQKIIKTQFKDPLINGFQSTLLKENVTYFKEIDKDMVQILHRGSSGSGHWFTVSAIGCQEGSINVFDSIYNDIDQESKVRICSILKHKDKSLKCSTPGRGSDGGVFSIAFAVALCFGLNPAKLIFNQEKMREHFLCCILEQKFNNFPLNIHTYWKTKNTVTVQENIFCICRGLYDSERIQCTNCTEWYLYRQSTLKNIENNVKFEYKINAFSVQRFNQYVITDVRCFRFLWWLF